MFDKLLIANRGEIACRVARTARDLGIRTVAVYSEADAEARHVRACDEAHLIGPAAAAESYLDADRILATALATGARAVHPGYGFLSENAAFAEACEKRGIAFVGPPASAIRAMGSKSEAKNIMLNANVPVLGGYQGEDQSLETLASAAHGAGYPVLIKAVSGGGGKGMRIVHEAGQFETALEAVRREAQGAFGDDRVLVEQYLAVARHVEVQVFADRQGETVHLFERDCSVQRRHQKVIEEAPAPGLDEDLRQRMGSAAVEAARAIGYVGAGTVEFLLDDTGGFYFMEMNTRLQVEHPVTELVTGQDLVEWQLRVAAGEPLPCRQQDLAINGHAMEARLYAENPDNDFLPSTGTLAVYDEGEPAAWKRLDSGVAQGDTIHPYYDPMIGKLVCWGPDRDAARRRLADALAEIDIAGVSTNLDFLRRLALLPAFAEAQLHTGIIGANEEALFARTAEPPAAILALAARFRLDEHARRDVKQIAMSADPCSPWGGGRPWRPNLPGSALTRFSIGDSVRDVTLQWWADGYQTVIDDRPTAVALAHLTGNRYEYTLGEDSGHASIFRNNDAIHVNRRGERWTLKEIDPGAGDDRGAIPGGNLNAPMPGSVIEIYVAAGDAVAAGDPLLVLEAMKMEHTITAPRDGQVRALLFQTGDQVREGDLLLELESEEPGDAA